LWYEPSGIRVVNHRVVQDLATVPVVPPLRVAVVADLHAGAPYIDLAKIDRIVALTNAEDPDLVLLAGDYVIQGVIGGRHIPIETTAARLATLSARFGVYAVIGNHDRWEDDANITKALETAGITVLEDRAVQIGGEDGFYLVGISDYATGRRDVASALSGVPEGEHALCFTHSPDIFPDLPPACALTVAGHTHGGQVRLPLLGRPIVPSRFGQRYAVGTIRENGKLLFVSSGIGTSIIPVRFGVPPEISLLDIR
jgi:predicted MPP superfamily phosphohydrolase